MLGIRLFVESTEQSKVPIGDNDDQRTGGQEIGTDTDASETDDDQKDTNDDDQTNATGETTETTLRSFLLH